MSLYLSCHANTASLEMRCVTQHTLLSNQLYLEMFVAVSHCLVQGLWLLAYHHHQTLTKTPLRYSVAALSHEVLVGIILQEQSLPTLQQDMQA